MPLSHLPRPRAIAFDLDGTLIDSRADIAATCNHVLTWAGRPPLPESTIATFVGDGARTLLARAFALAGDASELTSLLEEFNRYYAAHPVARTRWMTGAREALDAAHAAGILAAVVTNKSRQATLPILDALGVRARFAAISAGGDGPLKPSAEPVLAVMRAMGTSAAETWVVGDGVQDIGAARAAGCVAIAVMGGFHDEAKLRAMKPDALLTSLEELRAVFGP